MNTNTRHVVLGFSLLAVLAVGIGAGWGLAQWRAAGQHVAADAAAPAAAAERKVLYWYDPMVPTQKFDKPGKSPFMDMQLVPRYVDEGHCEYVDADLPECTNHEEEPCRTNVHGSHRVSQATCPARAAGRRIPPTDRVVPLGRQAQSLENRIRCVETSSPPTRTFPPACASRAAPRPRAAMRAGAIPSA